MTLTADDKGRLTCQELFPPRAGFDAQKDERGRVTLTRLVKQEQPPKLVKPIRYKDGWLRPGDVEGLRREPPPLSAAVSTVLLAKCATCAEGTRIPLKCSRNDSVRIAVRDQRCRAAASS